MNCPIFQQMLSTLHSHLQMQIFTQSPTPFYGKLMLWRVYIVYKNNCLCLSCP